MDMWFCKFIGGFSKQFRCYCYFFLMNSFILCDINGWNPTVLSACIVLS